MISELLVGALSLAPATSALLFPILPQAEAVAEVPSADDEPLEAPIDGTSIASEEEQLEGESSAAQRLSSWEAPPSCIQLEELRGEVEKQLSADPEVARQVRGEMLRSPAGWIATLTVFESDRRLGERLLELSGDECRTHDETLALVIALLLEHGPPPPSEPPDEAPSPDGEQVPPPQPPKEEPREPEPPPEPSEPRRATQLRAGAGMRVIPGWLPSVGWGPTGFVGARLFGVAALELVGDFYVPETTVFERVTVRASGGRVHGRACALPRWGALGLSPCAGLGWMGLSAAGSEVDSPQTVFFGTMEGSLSGAASYHWTDQWSLEGGVEGIFPFKRGRFVLENETGEEGVHGTPRAIFSAHVGVVLTL